MWVILLSIVAFIAIRFFMSVGEQKQELRQVGGVRQKYSMIVDQCLGGHRDSQIFHEVPDRVVVGVSNFGGSTLFTLTATFQTLTVQYEVKNDLMGNHKLEWEFDKNMNQELMLERMNRDIGRLNDRMMA